MGVLGFIQRQKDGFRSRRLTRVNANADKERAIAQRLSEERAAYERQAKYAAQVNRERSRIDRAKATTSQAKGGSFGSRYLGGVARNAAPTSRPGLNTSMDSSVFGGYRGPFSEQPRPVQPQAPPPRRGKKARRMDTQPQAPPAYDPYGYRGIR